MCPISKTKERRTGYSESIVKGSSLKYNKKQKKRWNDSIPIYEYKLMKNKKARNMFHGG